MTNQETTVSVADLRPIHYALAYAQLGWKVFPVHTAPRKGNLVTCTCSLRMECPQKGKHPVTAHGLHDATTDTTQIRQWWSKMPLANIGLLTEGWWVVDIDPRNGGVDSIQELVRQWGSPERGLVSHTGGGGAHLFMVPSGPQLAADVPRQLAPGVDLKGAGGYVILPPSMHASGGQYVWAQGTGAERLQKLACWAGEAPAAALELFRPAVASGIWVEDIIAELGKTEEVAAPGTGPASTIEPTPTRRQYAQHCLVAACTAIRESVEGERNNILNREAYSMGGLVAAGLLSDVEARKALCAAAMELQDEEFTADEIDRTIDRSMAVGAQSPRRCEHIEEDPFAVAERDGLPAAEAVPIADIPEYVAVSGPGWNWSELSLAKRQLELIEGQYGYLVFDRGRLWYYDQTVGHWEPLPGPVLDSHLGWHGAESKDGKKILSMTSAKNKAIRHLLPLLRQVPGYFDDAPVGCNAANGWVTDDGELRPHDRIHRQLYTMKVEYRPGEALGEYAQTFLARCIPDRVARQACQEFLGAALFQTAQKYQKALYLYGMSGSGKSELIEVIRSLFAQDSVCAVKPDIMGDQNARDLLRGRVINLVDEVGKNIGDTDALKAIVTGGEIFAKQPYQPMYSFQPRAAHVFASDHMPDVGDHTDGFWRRFLVVPFGKPIQPEERVREIGKHVVDQDGDTLIGWALEGLQRLQKVDDYSQSKNMLEVKETWRTAANPVAAFVTEVCELSGWTPSTVLYGRYKAWCIAEGYKNMSHSSFGRQLTAIGIERRRDKRLWFRNLTLIDHAGSAVSGSWEKPQDH